ncbi:6448_t:CDS:1, partial [Entrophospora sp. SA101]
PNQRISLRNTKAQKLSNGTSFNSALSEADKITERLAVAMDRFLKLIFN